MYRFYYIVSAIIGLSLAFVNAAAQAEFSPIVHTLNGDIKGTVQNTIYAWKGIPYAEAPVGNLRYQNPVAAKSWQGVLDATQFKSVCPQLNGVLARGENKNEDCLYLNVWSPAPDGKKRPVMFWIHGGGFMSGSGSADIYDGSVLAKKGDIVLVTINYRLGPFGFLYFNQLAKGDLSFGNNLGLKDQILALKWVHDNIEAFGGDPNLVTIFGESAGARSVLALMADPDAKGLFKRAIAQSATPNFSWTPEMATSITKTYLDILHVSKDSLEKLLKLPADTLVKAVDRLDAKLKGTTGWNRVFTPTVDNESCYHTPIAGDVDLLIGTNLDESSLFATKQMDMMPKSLSGLERYLTEMDKNAVKRITGSYKNYPSKKAILQLLTDAIFRMPSIEYATSHAESGNVYMYRFDWSSSALKVAGLRSFHGLELPFVFGNYDAVLAKKMLIMANKKKVHRLADNIQQAWINFAKTGNPNDAGKNEWQGYSSENRSTWIFNSKSIPQVDPDSLQRKAWAGTRF